MRHRNFARVMFCDEQAQALFADWPAKARDLVAFQLIDAGHPDDPALAELVGDLSVHSELFRRLWAQHPVRDKGHGTVQIVHPLVGTMEPSYEALRLPDEPDQALVTYSAPRSTEASSALQLLVSWPAGNRR